MTRRCRPRWLLALLAAVVGCNPAPRGPAAESFTDAQSGVRMDIPPGWRDRYSVLVLPAGMDPSGHSAARSIYFRYQPKDTSIVPQVLVGLIIYRAAEWAIVAAEAGPPQGDVLAQHDSTVLIASLPQSNPFAPGSADAAAFDSLQLTLDQVTRAVR